MLSSLIPAWNFPYQKLTQHNIDFIFILFKNLQKNF